MRPLNYRAVKRRAWALLACAVWPVHFAAAQFVELKAEIEVSDWSRNAVRPWTTAIHCVVGTNSWQMDGDFMLNARVTYRFTGTNLVEESFIIKDFSKELMERLNQPGMPAGSAPPIGRQTTRVIASMDGNPGRTVRQPDYLTEVARIGWLAFCSGPCLKREGRLVFPPNDLWKELVLTSSFKDRTVVFDDALGLPKAMDLWTTNRQQVMQYRVVSSTNCFDWEFPLEFYLAQYRPAPVPELEHVTAGTNGWQLEFVARGTVKAIGQRAELPGLDGASEAAAPANK